MPKEPARSTRPGAVGRRQLMRAAAGTAAGLAAFSLSTRSPWYILRRAHADEPIGNYPVTGSTVRFGFTVPQTGPYADEGADELRAYKLAVRHLNEGGGMLETLKPSALKGNGVLGKKVEYVVGDTQTKPDAARAVARLMIERDKVIMYSGSSSSAVAVALGYLAQESGVIYMVGLSHSNDTTGKDRRRYSFREFFDAYMSGKALAPILAKEYGKDRRSFHLTADYTWGHTQYESMKQFTEKEGWTTVNNIMTPLGTTDYSQYLTAVLNSDADVLVLNHYGLDMVNSLTQAVSFGMRDRKVGSRQMEVVVPLISDLMAKGAGPQNIDGILGTGNWDWHLDDEGSKAFVAAFQKEYGFPPSQAAHTCYVQTLLYADAVERAGTFYPPEVIKALEDFEYTGTRPGKAIYRACDHQSLHGIVVVRGKGPGKAQPNDLLDVVAQVPAESVEYSCDQMPGDLGPYKPAA